MTEDSLSFYAYKKTNLGYAEFSSVLKYCGESVYFADLMDFWKEQTVLNYKEKKEKPDPALWFKTYSTAIDAAENESGIVGIFRHIGIGSSYLYHSKEEIEKDYADSYKNYFLNVKLPTGGTGAFTKAAFDYAVVNVADAWSKLYAGLADKTFSPVSLIKNWNLDTGVDMDTSNNEVTYWSKK